MLLELEDQELSTGRRHCKLKLPRRVWLRDDALSWLLCDYCFPDEREKEAVDNVCKIWGERDLTVYGEEMLCEEKKTESQTVTTPPTATGIAIFMCSILIIIICR